MWQMSGDVADYTDEALWRFFGKICDSLIEQAEKEKKVAEYESLDDLEFGQGEGLRWSEISEASDSLLEIYGELEARRCARIGEDEETQLENCSRKALEHLCEVWQERLKRERESKYFSQYYFDMYKEKIEAAQRILERRRAVEEVERLDTLTDKDLNEKFSENSFALYHAFRKLGQKKKSKAGEECRRECEQYVKDMDAVFSEMKRRIANVDAEHKA